MGGERPRGRHHGHALDPLLTREPAVTLALFDDLGPETVEPLGPGAAVLRGFARGRADALLQAIDRIVAVSPLRHMTTPGGHRMSVAMTNCGALGWVSEPSGYRYADTCPLTGTRWPAMPGVFVELAAQAAAAVGFAAYAPDACLVNRYEPGTKLTAHRDYDEEDQVAPIVSVSLGLPATFLFGGPRREDPSRALRLVHGDVTVWGGPSRHHYHAVKPVEDGWHPRCGRTRWNLTFRVARQSR